MAENGACYPAPMSFGPGFPAIAIAMASTLAAYTPAARAEPLTPARVAALRAQVRANFFVPDPLPPIDGKVHRRFEPARGVSAEAVTYATEFGMRVPAILYLPKPLPKGRIPAVIIVDGHGGDKYSWYSYYAGVVFARAGAAVLTYDQAGEGERSSTRESHTREHDKLEGGPTMARRLAGLMITDVMQAVSYLASRPEIDPARIGAGGYSMGSFVLALAGAVEPRLRACAMVGGGNLDGPGGYWDGSKPMCQGLPYQSLSFLGDRGAVLYALQVARGPVMIWNGRVDSIVAKAKDPFFADLRTHARQLAGGRTRCSRSVSPTAPGTARTSSRARWCRGWRRSSAFPAGLRRRCARCPRCASVTGRALTASRSTRRWHQRSARAARSPSAMTCRASSARI